MKKLFKYLKFDLEKKEFNYSSSIASLVKRKKITESQGNDKDFTTRLIKEHKIFLKYQDISNFIYDDYSLEEQSHDNTAIIPLESSICDYTDYTIDNLRSFIREDLSLLLKDKTLEGLAIDIDKIDRETMLPSYLKILKIRLKIDWLNNVVSYGDAVEVLDTRLLPKYPTELIEEIKKW